MKRKEQLENIIRECCENSSIYYEGKNPAVKYLGGQGKNESSIGMYGIRTDRAFRNDNRLRKW